MDIILYVLSLAMVNGTACFPPNRIESTQTPCSMPSVQMEEVWRNGRWELQERPGSGYTTTLQICYESVCVRTYPKGAAKK